MALNVKLNFDECYEIENISSDLLFSRFNTLLKDGNSVALGIEISDTEHPYLPGVFNLAFGPFNEDKIDDQAKLYHQNHSKVFSTILFAALSFLSKNKDKYLGIDGSSNARTYMYYRCIQNNYAYLNRFFIMYGVKYYVRVLRKEDNSDDLFPVDGSDLKAITEIIEKEPYVKGNNLYNYFIFKLKEDGV
jgi:hypothetical protein